MGQTEKICAPFVNWFNLKKEYPFEKPFNSLAVPAQHFWVMPNPVRVFLCQLGASLVVLPYWCRNPFTDEPKLACIWSMSRPTNSDCLFFSSSYDGSIAFRHLSGLHPRISISLHWPFILDDTNNFSLDPWAAHSFKVYLNVGLTLWFDLDQRDRHELE